MRYRNIPHFADGLIQTGAGSGRGKAPHTSLLDCENIRTHSGSAEPRPGQLFLDPDDLVADVDIDHVYEYTREYHSLGQMQFYREYLFNCNKNLYSWGEGNAWTFFINDGEPLESNDIWVAEYADWAVIGDGVGKPHKYDAVDYFRLGILPPTVTPSLIRSAVENADIVGYRRYKYRYIRYIVGGSGEEITYIASEFSDTTLERYPDGEENFNNRAMQVGLTASTDPQVTHIELYATMVKEETDELAGSTYYLLSREANTTHSFVDNIGNITLENAEDYPIEDTTITWTAPPDGLSLFIYFKDRVYGVDLKNDPSVLRYSELGEVDAWPILNNLEVRTDDGDVITCLAVRGNSLYIFKNRSIYVITGDPIATPMMEVVTGGEVTGTQTEFGLGCTAPRSLASYGDDALVFYSNIHGVWEITASTIIPLTKNISGLKGLDDACAGVVYVGDDNEPYYILSQPSGVAYACHIPTGKWCKDTNVNVDSFLVDSQGRVIAGDGVLLNHFYDSTATDDNGTDITCMKRHAWLNLRDGEMCALIRGIRIQQFNITSLVIELYNQSEVVQATYTITDFTEPQGFDAIAGRLFSAKCVWTGGSIESMTYLYQRRLSHGD